jgi:ubiquinone/menaquinone biosynthesis C-methylase UbiE
MILPFTYPWIIRKLFDSSRTILDVACGNGTFMAQVNNDAKYEITGIDLFDPYLESAKQTNAYKEVIKLDVRNINYPDNSFDIVHASQLIEHLKTDETLQLIQKMEKIAAKKIVIGTPNGHFDQDEYDGNELQKHQSHWTYNDFHNMGYKVYGQGLGLIYAENGLLFTKFGKIPPLRYALYVISYIASPLVYVLPQLGAHIIAVKNK